MPVSRKKKSKKKGPDNFSVVNAIFNAKERNRRNVRKRVQAAGSTKARGQAARSAIKASKRRKR